jgi:hypothetical protein
MVEPTEINENAKDPDPTFIASVQIEGNLMNQKQLNDPNIRWIFDLKNEYKSTAPIIDKTILNDEQRSLFAQWNRLRISGQNLYREYTDQNDNIKFQYVVPSDQRQAILEAAHDDIFSGHLGYDKTIDRIIPKFYWPKSHAFIEEHIKSCTNCQAIKTPNRYNIAPLQPIKPNRPGEIWTSDIMGPIKTT